jgi:hypothetical protein
MVELATEYPYTYTRKQVTLHKYPDGYFTVKDKQGCTQKEKRKGIGYEMIPATMYHRSCKYTYQSGNAPRQYTQKPKINIQDILHQKKQPHDDGQTQGRNNTMFF